MSEDEKKWEEMKECYKGTDMALLIKKVSALETSFNTHRHSDMGIWSNGDKCELIEEKLKELEDNIQAHKTFHYIQDREYKEKLKEVEENTKDVIEAHWNKMMELEQLLPKKIEIIKESLEKQCDKWFDKRDKDHIKDHLELEQKYTNISDIEAYNSVRIGQLKMVLREEIENRNSYLRTMLLLAPESLAEHYIKNVEETIKKGEKELEKIGSEDIIKDIVPGSMCKCGHIAWVHAEYTDWCSECDCTKFEKEPSASPAEDPNTIHGINIYCPNCGLTQRGVFTSGKELIAEFRNDIITKLDYFSSKIWEVHLNPNFEKEIIEALKGLDKDWKLKQEARKNQ